MSFLLADESIHCNRFNRRVEINQLEDFYIIPLLLITLSLEQLPMEAEEAIHKLNELGLKSEPAARKRSAST